MPNVQSGPRLLACMKQDQAQLESVPHKLLRCWFWLLRMVLLLARATKQQLASSQASKHICLAVCTRLLARLLLLAKLTAPQLALEGARVRRVAALPALGGRSAHASGHELAPEPDADAGAMLGYDQELLQSYMMHLILQRVAQAYARCTHCRGCVHAGSALAACKSWRTDPAIAHGPLLLIRKCKLPKNGSK